MEFDIIWFSAAALGDAKSKSWPYREGVKPGLKWRRRARKNLVAVQALQTRRRLCIYERLPQSVKSLRLPVR